VQIKQKLPVLKQLSDVFYAINTDNGYTIEQYINKN